MTARELTKEVLNPFAESIKVPIESVTGFRLGPRRNTGQSVNIEPLFPFAVTGIDDVQLSVFLTPTRTGRWIWGLGPIVELPTASDEQLGTGKWSGGPTGPSSTPTGRG